MVVRMGKMAQFKGIFSEVRAALATVFSRRNYRLLAVAAFVFSAATAWLLPVFTIPGNTLDFWMSIAPWWSYALLFVFSSLMALLVPMQAFILKERLSAGRAGKGAAMVSASFVSTLYSSAACAGCIATLGTFMGAGATLFLVNHRMEFIALGAVLSVVSIFSSAKMINRSCNCCSVAGKTSAAKEVFA